MTIRLEHPDDYNTILQLTYEAFLTLDYPGRRRLDEHYLIHLLQGSPFIIQELCFVAEQNGEIVGHILYTKSEILCPDNTIIDTITFGPLSVLPEFQKQGIGAALVHHSIEKAQELGYGAVLITGVSDYYPKLGFKRARDYGLTLPDGTAEDSFMAYELKPDYLTGGGTLRVLPPEFEQSEKDDAGFEAFHKHYMKEHYPEILTLRPLFDNDIALMERWLYLAHVAKWYKHPEHWLKELHERRGEFSFLTHFIVEYEGVPIGFCQYYDCYFAQEHEVWNDKCHTGEKQGEVFSIDYLIGEPDYLSKGYGKEIVRLLTERIQNIPSAKKIIVQPEQDNDNSRAVLTANGYTCYKDTDVFFLPLGVKIREITKSEVPLLKDFLYHAIFLHPGTAPLPREVIYNPDIYIYIENFGGKDDCGLIAKQNGIIVGAVWTRIIPAFGHVDDETPELAFSVLPKYRGQGIGTMLLTHLFELLRERGYRRTSLSVQKENPALRLYLRMGYEIIHEYDEDYIMVRTCI